MDRTAPILLALNTGCWSVEFDRADDWIAEKATASTTDPVVPTGGGSDAEWTTGGVHTVTGPEPGTSGPEAPLPPMIPTFVVDPTALDAVGAVTVLAKAENADHVRVELDGEVLAEADTSEIAVVWEALSSDDNDLRVFQARAVGPGGEATRDASVAVNVPLGGKKVWLYEQPSSPTRFPERLAVHEDYTCIVGTQIQNKLKLDLVCLYGGELLWSRTIEQWTELSAVLDASFTQGTAIDFTPGGELLVSGNLTDDLGIRSYWARLSPDGALISERLGNVGEAAYAIAAGPAGEVALGGSEATLQGSHLAWWSFDANNVPIGTGLASTKHEFAVDRIWEIDINGKGEVWAGGERGVPDKVVINGNSPRAFIGHWSLYGAPGGTWESAGVAEPDVALGVMATEHGACMAGVTLASGIGFVRCFDAALTLTGSRVLAGEAVEARGIARNRRGDAVVGCTTPTGRGLALALDPSAVEGAPRWSALYEEPSLAMTARDVDCDAWGYCQLLVHRTDEASMPTTAVLKLTP